MLLFYFDLAIFHNWTRFSLLQFFCRHFRDYSHHTLFIKYQSYFREIKNLTTYLQVNVYREVRASQVVTAAICASYECEISRNAFEIDRQKDVRKILNKYFQFLVIITTCFCYFTKQ